MNKASILHQAIITFIVSLAIFAIFLFQFPSYSRFTIFFINKALAQTAVVLVGLSFLLGPLAKIFHFMSHFVHYRKYFGLLGFLVIVLHIDTSLMQIYDRFPLSWYQDHLLGIGAAVLATLILSVLAITSHQKLIHALGGHRWKAVQRTGYIAITLILIHIFAASGSRWQQWRAGETDMPTSFLVFVFGIVVIVARLLALLIDRQKPQHSSS